MKRTVAKPQEKGALIISLDFELYWGMTDKIALADYKERLDGERQTAIPRMLELFKQYGIHATWSTVGMLAFDTKKELLASLPTPRPEYADRRLSTYVYLESGAVGESEAHDPYHFGASLIRDILTYPNQEIGSHTFSHYYCAEEGQTIAAFRADLEASRFALARFGASATSLVLPRNQWQEGYADAAYEAGIRSYRGNQRSVLYAPRRDSGQNLLLRAVRLVDHYLPLSGNHIYARDEVTQTRLFDIPASLFLRPYIPKLGFLEGLRRWRITRGMEKAAREGKIFHLWWHPYNMGLYCDENFATLEYILKHFKKLQERYGMESMGMAELADALTP